MKISKNKLFKYHANNNRNQKARAVNVIIGWFLKKLSRFQKEKIHHVITNTFFALYSKSKIKTFIWFLTKITLWNRWRFSNKSISCHFVWLKHVPVTTVVWHFTECFELWTFKDYSDYSFTVVTYYFTDILKFIFWRNKVTFSNATIVPLST